LDLREALIDWDDADDADGNTSHIAEHGLTPQEVESTLFDDGTTFDLSDTSAPALSRLETGKALNPTLATLHKWAEALGRKLNFDLSSS
jgi:transcriptional regulator with XRE-family HTH domain